MVLAFHLELGWFSLGWAGVPLFFVLSGFLITGILLDAKGGDGYLRNFYARRALRIFPIYYLTLLIVTAVAVGFGERVDSLPFYLVYAQNYLLGATNFNPSFPIAFNHSWSLAIEEQFYLLWPLAILRLSRRGLLIATIALFALGFGSRAVLLAATNNPAIMETSLPGQLDSLAAGACLAVLLRSGIGVEEVARKARWVLAISAAALGIMISHNGLNVYWHPESWATNPYNLPTLSLMALLFASIVALSIAGTPLLSRVLRLGFLRHIGKISYALYMYHFPIFVLVDKSLWKLFPGDQGALLNLAHPAGKIALTYLVAILSWRLVESPILRLKDRFTRKEDRPTPAGS